MAASLAQDSQSVKWVVCNFRINRPNEAAFIFFNHHYNGVLARSRRLRLLRISVACREEDQG